MPKNREFNNLPDMMSLDDVRLFLKVSKLTARYYLKSGLLKCTYTGKQTRCYRIKKSDFISFYRRYTAYPSLFFPPENWYKSEGRMPLKDAPTEMPANITGSKIQHFYKRLLTNHADLLTPDEISDVTGYSRRTVSRWCHRGELKAIMISPKIRVPKVFLLEFLSSDIYQNIRKKSKQHRQHLIKIQNM